MAPKLYHVLYGAPHWKQFEVSDSLVHVHNYIKVHGVPPPAGPTPLTHNSVRLQAWEALEAWREVLYPPAAIHDGWEAKVGTA